MAKTSIGNSLENIIAFAEVLLDESTEFITKKSKEAGNAISLELEIRKLNAEKSKYMYSLGEETYETKQVNFETIKTIEEIEEKIKELKQKKKNNDEKDVEKTER